MDLVTASFLVLGAVGAGGVILHYAGYIPKPYRDRLERTESTLAANLQALPNAIGLEVENALNRVAASQEAKMAQAAETAEKSLAMSGVRQLGIEKAQMREMQGLMVDGIMGPLMSAIEAWNPAWAERLRQVPPDLLIRFIESPWFQANIMPRIQPLIEKFQGNSAHMTATATGWGT